MAQLNSSIRDIPIPQHMTRLPISSKGFPVPWFVAKVDGEWDFRLIKPGGIIEAIRRKVCWICGGQLDACRVFAIGPMCTINRVSAEPPSHLDCARYAVQACPFLNNPNTRRNEKDMPTYKQDAPGDMIMRNPGVTALWICNSWNLMQLDNGILFQLGEPERVEWYCEGRTATRAEVEHSISTGLPLLEKAAEEDGEEGKAELRRCIIDANAWLPKQESTT